MNMFRITSPVNRDYFPKSVFVFVFILAESSNTVIVLG